LSNANSAALPVSLHALRKSPGAEHRVVRRQAVQQPGALADAHDALAESLAEPDDLPAGPRRGVAERVADVLVPRLVLLLLLRLRGRRRRRHRSRSEVAGDRDGAGRRVLGVLLGALAAPLGALQVAARLLEVAPCRALVGDRAVDRGLGAVAARDRVRRGSAGRAGHDDVGLGRVEREHRLGDPRLGGLDPVLGVLDALRGVLGVVDRLTRLLLGVPQRHRVAEHRLRRDLAGPYRVLRRGAVRDARVGVDHARWPLPGREHARHPLQVGRRRGERVGGALERVRGRAQPARLALGHGDAGERLAHRRGTPIPGIALRSVPSYARDAPWRLNASPSIEAASPSRPYVHDAARLSSAPASPGSPAAPAADAAIAFTREPMSATCAAAVCW
jgi:hypothetical protein